MEKFKGKPGPWRWEGKVLCNDAHIVGGDRWTFNDADKKLIAAAPELLEALQKMVSKAYKQNWNDAYPEEIQSAQAAINKALGEKQ